MVKAADRYLAELKTAVDYYRTQYENGNIDYTKYDKARDMYECAREMKKLVERGY